MKLKVKIMFILMTIVFLSVFSGCTTPENTVFLFAKVTDGFSGLFVRGANFTINGETKQTNYEGYCQFDVPPGTYTIVGSATGYKTRQEILVLTGDGLSSGIHLYPDVPIQGNIILKNNEHLTNIISRNVTVECMLDGVLQTLSTEADESFNFSIDFEGVPKKIYAEVTNSVEYEPGQLKNTFYRGEIVINTGWADFFLDVDDVQLEVEYSGFVVVESP